MSVNTGFRLSRPDYLGTHGVAFDASKAAPLPSGVVVDEWRGRPRTRLARAVTMPVRNQGGLGSCQYFSTCAGMAIADPSGREPAPLAGYVEGLFFDGAVNADGTLDDRGATGETVEYVARDIGIPSEEEWPYTDDPDKWMTRPSIKVLQSGWRHRLDATHRILSLGQQLGSDVRASINAGRAVRIGCQINRAFMRYFDSTDTRALIWHSFSDPVGGHAQLIVGFVEIEDGEHAYIVRGSWGADGGWDEMLGHSLFGLGALNACDEVFSIYVAKE